MKKAKVYVRLPATGLGNMLLTWSRGFVFARINDLPLVTSGWGGIRWGAWIRWEKKKRLYWGYFQENSWWEKTLIKYRKRVCNIVVEPEIESTSLADDENALFLFEKIYQSPDLFGPIRSYRDIVRQAILDMLSPAMKQRLGQYASPAISVHIRRGDFKIANPITPLSFFINAINTVRETTGEDWPVSLFTDATADEVKEVTDLPGVTLAENKPDILDILLMGKSKVIVLSRGSTFSYWAAFLSDAFVIKPETDWQGTLRPIQANEPVAEEKIDFNNAASVEKLKRSLLDYQWQTI